MTKTAYEQAIHSATRASARPLRRTVDKLVGPPLSKEITVGRIKHGDAIHVDVDRDRGAILEPHPATGRDPHFDETLSL